MSSLIVAESGLEGLTMPALAKRLGVSAASLYKHFSSKQELLAVLAFRVVEELDRVLRAAIADREAAGSWETLAVLTGAYAELYVQAPTTAILMDAFIINPRELLTDRLWAPTWELMERWWSKMEALVQELGLSREAAVRTGWLVWTTTQGALSAGNFGSRRDLPPPEELARQATLCLLRGAGIVSPECSDALWVRGCTHGALITRGILEEAAKSE